MAKIEILTPPKQRGDSVSVRVRFTYGKTSDTYGFTIPCSRIEASDLKTVLKELYEEKQPTPIEPKKLAVKKTINW